MSRLPAGDDFAHEALRDIPPGDQVRRRLETPLVFVPARRRRLENLQLQRARRGGRDPRAQPPDDARARPCGAVFPGTIAGTDARSFSFSFSVSVSSFGVSFVTRSFVTSSGSRVSGSRAAAAALSGGRVSAGGAASAGASAAPGSCATTAFQSARMAPHVAATSCSMGSFDFAALRTTSVTSVALSMSVFTACSRSALAVCFSRRDARLSRASCCEIRFRASNIFASSAASSASPAATSARPSSSSFATEHESDVLGVALPRASQVASFSSEQTAIVADSGRRGDVAGAALESPRLRKRLRAGARPRVRERRQRWFTATRRRLDEHVEARPTAPIVVVAGESPEAGT